MLADTSVSNVSLPQLPKQGRAINDVFSLFEHDPATTLNEKSLVDYSKTAGSKLLVENTRREEILRQLADGALAPIFLISGSSGSGKSHFISLMKQLGIDQAQRLISRPRRESDPHTDVSWDSSHKPDQIVIAYGKFGARYGFMRESFSAPLHEGKSAAVIVGDLGKITPFSRALGELIPMIPVISIHLDAPHEVIAARLMNVRGEAFTGEAEQRIQANGLLSRWSNSQLPLLKKLYDVHTFINISDAEHRSLGYEQVQLKPLSLELVSKLLQRFISDAKMRSSYFAADILSARHVSASIAGVPPVLTELLESKIVPSSNRLGAAMALKGGLAVALYLATGNAQDRSLSENSCFKNFSLLLRQPIGLQYAREVSLDIDWALPIGAEMEQAHTKLIEEVTGQHGTFRTHWEKSTFHSHKLSLEYANPDEGTAVYLDAIALSRIKPSGSNFCYEFAYDEYLAFRERKVTLASGAEVGIVPPEMLIAEKLIAGRGAALGKQDLSDALALIATEPVDFEVFAHMIEKQKHDPIHDGEFTLPVNTSSISEILTGLKEIGINEPRLVAITAARISVAQRLNAESIEATSDEIMLPFHWNFDNLKKVALTGRLLNSITQLEILLDNPTKAEEKILIGSIQPEITRQKLATLKQYLYYYAEYQLGRTDVFLRG